VNILVVGVAGGRRGIRATADALGIAVEIVHGDLLVDGRNNALCSII